MPKQYLGNVVDAPLPPDARSIWPAQAMEEPHGEADSTESLLTALTDSEWESPNRKENSPCRST